MIPRFARKLGLLAAALLIASCASLTVVDKSPDRETVETLLVTALACKDVAGQEPCKAGDQPKEIRLTDLDCEALPLRSGVREAAHARCAYEGEIIRASGAMAPLSRAESDFSLMELTPGSYIPTREWMIRETR